MLTLPTLPWAGMNTTSLGKVTSWPGHGTRPASQWRGLEKSLLHCQTLSTPATETIKIHVSTNKFDNIIIIMRVDMLDGVLIANTKD